MTTKKLVTVEDVLPMFTGKRLEDNQTKGMLSTFTCQAVEDSHDGIVKVIIGDSAITDGDDGAEVEIPTSVNVHAGDIVVVTTSGNGVIGSPIVTDVIGGGDRMNNDIIVVDDKQQQMDELLSGSGNVLSTARSGSSAHWYKRGPMVFVYITVSLNSQLAAYSLATVFNGLPRSVRTGATGILRADNGVTTIAYINTEGVLQVNTRESAMAANTWIFGSFAYMTPD